MTTGTRSWYVPPCFASRLFVVEQDSLLARSSCNNVLANSAPSCISPLFEFKFVYGFTSKDYQQPSRIMSREFRKLSVDTKFKDAAAFFEMDVDNFQDLAQQYKLDVYPAFLLLNPKDTDKEVGARVTGIDPWKLRSSIQDALNQLRAPPVRQPDPPRRRRRRRSYGMHLVR
ncbi:hypothetical protein PVAP13_1NG190400 [Panicum virgatum]|uniref:Thioredoxin domain-containing protein n=1 Tax=Panicum virgatum TaxID=38727 RepID=A0A8T0WYV4_PANVG|nr:hypothetical protein PVAP13_1NG190400 [Panicum virgatum]